MTIAEILKRTDKETYQKLMKMIDKVNYSNCMKRKCKQCEEYDKCFKKEKKYERNNGIK